MFCSIIVPVFQRPAVLALFIESLTTSIEAHSEVIFIDDGSPEASAEILEAAVRTLRNAGYHAQLVRHATPRGCGQSLNEGLQLASGEYLIFADSDLILVPGWQGRLVEAAQTIAPSTGAVAGMAASVLLYPQSGAVQHAGIRFSNSEARHWKLNASPASFVERHEEVQAAAFALFAMSRQVFEEVGLLDEEYLNGYEDFDYQFRARRHGHRTVLATTCPSFHWEQRNGPHRAVNRKSNLARLWQLHGPHVTDDLTGAVTGAVAAAVSASGATEIVDLAESRVLARAVRRGLSSQITSWLDLSHLVSDGEGLNLGLLPDGLTPRGSTVFLVENFVQAIDNHWFLRGRLEKGNRDKFVDLFGNVVAAEDLQSLAYPGRRVR